MTNDFWTKSTGAQRLRQHVKSSHYLSHWLHFGEYNNVEVASRQHNLLVSFCKTKPTQHSQTFVHSINFKRKVLDWLSLNPFIPYVRTGTDLLYHSSQVTIQFVNQKEWGTILDKIGGQSTLLSEVATLHQTLPVPINQQKNTKQQRNEESSFCKETSSMMLR